MTPATDEDELIAAALVAGKTHEEAAAAGGVSRSTVARRLRDPAFRDRVTQLRVETVSRSLGILADGLVGAVEQMIALCQHGESESVRLRAAVAVSETCRRLWADFDLSVRLRRLEEKLGIGAPAAG